MLLDAAILVVEGGAQILLKDALDRQEELKGGSCDEVEVLDGRRAASGGHRRCRTLPRANGRATARWRGRTTTR